MIRQILEEVVVVKTKQKNINGRFKSMTWNSDGFRDPGKHLFVKESIRKHGLDFIALLEMGRSNFTVPFLNGLAVGKDFPAGLVAF